MLEGQDFPFKLPVEFADENNFYFKIFNGDVDLDEDTLFKSKTSGIIYNNKNSNLNIERQLELVLNPYFNRSKCR